MKKDIIRVSKEKDNLTVEVSGNCKDIMNALGHLFDALFDNAPHMVGIFLDAIDDWRNDNDQVQV